MADALVSAVLEQLVSIVYKEVSQEVSLVVGVRKEVQNLEATFKLLLGVLEDAEQKQVTNRAVKDWLERLQEISYDADDVLDEWNTRILISQENAPTRNKQNSWLRHCLLSLCSCLKPVLVRHDIAHRIKNIRERLDTVAKDNEQFNLRVSLEGPRNQEIIRPPTSSFVDEIYGRDDIKNTIVSQLLSESSRQDLPVPVISIVGTGGFGKTALAQFILKQEQVVTKFQKRLWVCVSEPFDREKVARDIIEQAEGNATNAVGWETLHKKLCEAVKDKLFLLVLDDVWSYDDNIWGPLKLSLDGGAQGSRIMITTRDESVAKLMISSYIHRLEHLSDDDCWSLFRRIAFQGRQEDLEKLEEVGKGIAKKCKGVPLVAKMLASLMCLKESERDWRDVLESDIWKILPKDKSGFVPELWLSYLALPSHLKQCFMYCAIFKKDEAIDKVELVKLWMAHGFLGFDVTEDLEKKGAEYFDNLARRSFLQDFEKDEDGHIISCKMHDLVHDFAQFLTKCESTIPGTIRGGRHLSASNLENSSIYKQKNLRTLRPLSYGGGLKMPPGSFHQLACLRVLVLRHSHHEELPAEVDSLLHLRYLDLGGSSFEELPGTICNLFNLQTLKLNGCTFLCKLPQEIGKLRNLRHLEIERTGRLHYLPQRIGRLRNLRTLSKFIVGGESEGCKIEELKLLDRLEGSLQIRLKRVGDVNKDEQAELMKQKKNLRSLELDFGEYASDGNKLEIVCECLEPHSDLEELEIRYYPGPRFPLWISSLSKVRKLELYDCRQCLQLPCLGNLASLEDLTLWGLYSVKHIGCEFYGGVSFPSLRRLDISYMHELERLEFPVSKDKRKIIMPLLSDLSVTSCRKLRALAFAKDDESFPLLREFVIKSCRNLQELTGVGKLKSLEELKLTNLKSVERLGMEFLGISSVSDGDGDSVLIFPRLRSLEISNMKELERLELPVSKDRRKIIMPLLSHLTVRSCDKLRALAFPKDEENFPLLRELIIEWCGNLQELMGVGMLKSLEELKLADLGSVERLGMEFLGISSVSDGDGDSVLIFPKLMRLEFVRMDGLQEWVMPFKKDTEIFPNLVYLKLWNCNCLQSLPALGKLKSLGTLDLFGLDSVEHLGSEFLGISSDNGSAENGESVPVEVFPHLTHLKLTNMPNWEQEEEIHQIKKDQGGLTKIMPCLHTLEIVHCPKLKEVPQYMFSHALRYLEIKECPELTGLQEWVLPFKKDTEIFPNLVYLKLWNCNCLQSLPTLGKLKSLQTLKLHGLDSVEHLGSEFLGISSDNGSAENGESVPVEVFPHLTHLELSYMPNWEQKEEILQIEKDQGGLTKIMPCLHKLEIDDCPKLKVVPQYMFSHSLRYLKIRECPELIGMQPCFPPLLEELTLCDNVGFLSRLLPIGNNYPNLKIFKIERSLHSSLPEGFNRLTSIQEMIFSDSKDLEFMPEELKHHTMLQQVRIINCPILSEHCRKRENWSTTSSIPKIIINLGEISFSQ